MAPMCGKTGRSSISPRLAVCHAGVAERQLEAKGRRGVAPRILVYMELTTSPASLEDTISVLRNFGVHRREMRNGFVWK